MYHYQARENLQTRLNTQLHTMQMFSIMIMNHVAVWCPCRLVINVLHYAGASPYDPICGQDVSWSELSDDSSDLDYYCNYPYLPVSGSEGMVLLSVVLVCRLLCCQAL